MHLARSFLLRAIGLWAFAGTWAFYVAKCSLFIFRRHRMIFAGIHSLSFVHRSHSVSPLGSCQFHSGTPDLLTVWSPGNQRWEWWDIRAAFSNWSPSLSSQGLQRINLANERSKGEEKGKEEKGKEKGKAGAFAIFSVSAKSSLPISPFPFSFSFLLSLLFLSLPLPSLSFSLRPFVCAKLRIFAFSPST